MKVTIGNFLLRRLHEVGIRHLFGVPGDYNLGFMQQLEDRGEPAWVGNCNELNASYATDAYARINGIGAISPLVGEAGVSIEVFSDENTSAQEMLRQKGQAAIPSSIQRLNSAT